MPRYAAGKAFQGWTARIAIARALATDPPILDADDPTGNLDSETAPVVLSRFERLARLGKTILMITHDPGRQSQNGNVVPTRAESREAVE